MIVAFPDGTGAEAGRLTWNAGFCCGYAIANEVDDVGFLGALVDEIGRRVPVDRRRVYLAGMSNGAMLAYRAAAQDPRYAAIAPVSGAVGGTNRSGVYFHIQQPDHRVAVMIVHGRKVPYVLFEGGVSPLIGNPLRRNLAVADAVSFWVAADRCAAEPDRTVSAGLVHSVWRGCAPRGALELWELIDGGHSWPADTRFPAGDGAAQILDFFARHATDDGPR